MLSQKDTKNRYMIWWDFKAEKEEASIQQLVLISDK